MTGRFRRSLALLGGLAVLLLPLGCLVPNVRTDAPAVPRADRDTYRLIAGEAHSLAGCRYDYRVYEPRREGGAVTTVALGHGFLRDQDTLIDLARALANAGHRAVTLDFCNMRPWNGHHARNGRDLHALATRVSDGPIVYAGFSAGALAAALAAGIAGDDPTTLGIVTLDLVDQNDLARNALAALDVPLTGLQGPPSACNANGGGQRVFDTLPHAALDTLPTAGHCEFESPTDRLCELVCGDEGAPTDNERTRALIIARVLEAIEGLHGEKADGRADDAIDDTDTRPLVPSRT